ncbi:MAG TPA: IS200/IS605 family transposase [Candidatus Angelobacter sp.]|nr:IS200/IS605 family transposase [Candidatus Angelobacter sp.]
MAHVYASLLVHCVFSTKERKRLINDEMQPRLWAYIGGIARLNKFKALAVGGTPDHAHVLLSLSASMPVPKAVQLIKGGSSKWINDQKLKRTFAWQDGYGVFSIGISQVQRTIHYINHQKEHHMKVGFEDELKLILAKHGIVFVQD